MSPASASPPPVPSFPLSGQAPDPRASEEAEEGGAFGGRGAMRQVRASGSLGSGRVTADSFPRGSWPGLLRDLALQFPWVPVGASAFGLAGRPLVTSPPGPRHFLSASGCWAPSTLEAAPMSRSRTALSVPLPASPPGPQKTPLLGVASPGVGIDSARLSRERVGRLAHRPAASPLCSPLLRQGLPRTFGHRCSPGLEGGCSGGVSSGSSPKGAGGSLYPFI